MENEKKEIIPPEEENISLAAEFWEFVKHRKRYWLLPIVIVLVTLSLLIVFTQGSTVAPFIYTLF